MQRYPHASNILRAWLLSVTLACATPGGAAETPQSPPADHPAKMDRADLLVEMLFDGDPADTVRPAGTVLVEGAVTFAGGRRGKAASFDGQGWVDTGLSQDELNDEFTVECWVNPAARQRPHADIFGNHVGEGAGFVLQQDGSNTNQYMGAYGIGDAKWVITDAIPLAAGRWQHVALVKTSEELRLHLNGILVAETPATAPIRRSPMRVAVGLGYTDPGRAFRGSIDEFRIWNRALDDFDHAGIDPAAARETLAQCLPPTPRPTVRCEGETWTLATDDTRLTLGMTGSRELVVIELSCPATDWNWVARRVAVGLPRHVETGGRQVRSEWRFVEGTLDASDGQKLSLQFECDEPRLELTSIWHARKGPGPIHHVMKIANRSNEPVTVGEQPTFDLDLTGATDVWRFHSDGYTPDPVGIYRDTLGTDDAKGRYTARTAPTGKFIPYMVLDADGRHGAYLGLEWGFCRIEAVTLDGTRPTTVRVQAGNTADLRVELAPGDALELRPGFIGAYRGDLDDAGNSLRKWLFAYRVPQVLRDDASYPKVQWNAFGATGKEPGSWDPVESKYYPFIDCIAPLGFEEVMIDIGWWEGGEPDSDSADWASGMKRAADYAHEKGMRFGLYWTDDLDMADPEGRRRRADRIRRLFGEYGADSWRSDCTRGQVFGSSFAATRGFYQMVDKLAREIPGFQWENCSGGGQIKDYGSMNRAVKIFNSDTYSALHVRQAFHDSSYAFHSIQLEGHLGSTDGRFRPRGADGVKFAFRSTSMGAPEWFLDSPDGGNGSDSWTEEEKEALKSCVQVYKTRLRPLIRRGNLYHIFPRPDGRNFDGIEYYDPGLGKGVVYLFKPSKEADGTLVRPKGLEADRDYRLSFADGTFAPKVISGAELMNAGLEVRLEGDVASELLFLERL